MERIIKGWYYLHTNHSLIFKPSPDAIEDIRESDFCHTAWAWYGDKRGAWNILVESLSLGADEFRVMALSQHWQCNDSDAINYATLLGLVLGTDGDQKTVVGKDFVNLQESPCGFGVDYLHAFADLCKQLGYTGGKMWNATFESLLKTEIDEHK